jgi:hypothetical protein
VAVAHGIATEKPTGESLTLEWRQPLHGRLRFTLGENL